jgi:hypothetical protein
VYAVEIARPYEPLTPIELSATAFNVGAMPPNQPPEPTANSNTYYGVLFTQNDWAGFVIPTNYYTYIQTD